ncbi:cupin domain-containing protein [uncultured Arcticibacterium sp.]|uniref:cupin domain-containing protein n=1 Tax=uncultured Arcticibacterium sp. TaxID=2173042 RepID=UPI0030FCAC1C
MTVQSKALVEDQDIPWEDLGKGIKRKVMAYNDGLMILKVGFEKGGIGDLHHHPHTQASYVSRGKFEVSIADEKKVLNAGDVFFVNPDLVHGVLCLEEGELVDIFNPKREDFI